MPSTPRSLLVALAIVAAALIAPAAVAPPAAAERCTHRFRPADAARIPTIVTEAGSGHVFCFAPGTYDMTDVIRPHAGDRLIGSGAGRRGTILRGARTISGWTLRNGLYVHRGGVERLPLGGDCANGTTACRYPDWLYVNGNPGRRVLSPCTRSTVTGRQFCIDYEADRMYLAENPRGDTVEYSFVPQAIVGLVDRDVTIEALQVTKYANAAQEGAAILAGPGWRIDRVDVNRTHSCAIAIPGRGIVVRHSRFHHNGQFGFCSSGGSINSRFVGNEVDHNNTLGFDATVGAGGGKFTGTRNLTFARNKVHHNDGTGIWLDADNKGTKVSRNRSSNNTSIYGGGDGIKIEVSCDVTVSDNVTRDNARGGIHINNAQRVLVGGRGSGNTISVPRHGDYGVVVHGSGREGGVAQAQCGPDSKELATDNRVIGNKISMPRRGESWNGVIGGSGGVEIRGNRFAGNDYHMASCRRERWKWWDGSSMETVPFSGRGTSWRGFGQDLGPKGSCGR